MRCPLGALTCRSGVVFSSGSRCCFRSGVRFTADVCQSGFDRCVEKSVRVWTWTFAEQLDRCVDGRLFEPTPVAVVFDA